MNEDTHIYLYAKGHYAKTDVVKDLRIILGKRCAISPEYISNSDILLTLSQILYPLIQNEYHFADIVRELVNCKSFESSVRAILSKIALCRTVGLDIGSADPNILPLRK